MVSIPTCSSVVDSLNLTDVHTGWVWQATPQTPLDRVLAAKVLSPAQEAQLLSYRDSLNPAQVGGDIADLRTRLLVLAKDKTEQHYLVSFPPHCLTSTRASASARRAPTDPTSFAGIPGTVNVSRAY